MRRPPLDVQSLQSLRLANGEIHPKVMPLIATLSLLFSYSGSQVQLMSPRYPAPPARRLRVYAFDPQTASRLGSVDYAFATISLPWGTAKQDKLQPGPVND